MTMIAYSGFLPNPQMWDPLATIYRRKDQPFVMGRRRRMIATMTALVRPRTGKSEVWMVRRRPGSVGYHGLLLTGSGVYRCILGRSGITTRKKEGDGATPAGRHRILGGYRNPGRIGFAAGSRYLRIAELGLGWCDEPASSTYNRPVRLPFSGSHEQMRRADRLYDACLVLDWNFSTRSRNRGSAIFLHMTREDLGPTAGCIALDPAILRRLLPSLLRGVCLVVQP